MGLTISDADFYYCTIWNYEKIKEALSVASVHTRVCYMTTESCRMYLIIRGKTLEYMPYTKSDNKWHPVRMNSSVESINVVKYCRSEEDLKTILHSAFDTQFPQAAESYYQTIPNYSEIKPALLACPQESTLVENHLIYTVDDDTGIDDGDGIITIVTGDGQCMVPYSDVEGIKVLQMYRAKLHPDSKIEFLNESFWRKISDFVSQLQCISWSSFRRLIDNLLR